MWCELALVDGRVQERVAIAVADGRFGAIETGVTAPAGATRLAGFTIAGMANSHSHAFHRVLRARTQAGCGSFWTWRDLMYRAAERLDPDSYHRLARATFAEMAMAGITVVGEFHYLHHQRDGTPYANPNAMGEALMTAATEAGIRITLLDTLYLHGGLTADGYAPVARVQRRFSDRTSDNWAQRLELLAPSSTQRIGAAVHSVRAVDPASMAAVREWAEQRGAPVHAHVSEQQAENEQCLSRHGRTPTRLIHDAGLLGDRFSAIHATHLSADDRSRLQTTSSTVCLCPTTERDLGDGIGPGALLAAAEVRLTVGTDSHAVIDMFEEARAVELDERVSSQRRGTHAASSLLAMATINGHRSLGWDDAGTIATGCRADLVTIALDSVRTAGITANTALEGAVFAATAADITHVLVDGNTVVSDGRHTRIDVSRELGAAIADLMEP